MNGRCSLIKTIIIIVCNKKNLPCYLSYGLSALAFASHHALHQSTSCITDPLYFEGPHALSHVIGLSHDLVSHVIPLKQKRGIEMKSIQAKVKKEVHTWTPTVSLCGLINPRYFSLILSLFWQERERGGQQMGPRGTKRREKNRDAARKSRRKQTERADELHEVWLLSPSASFHCHPLTLSLSVSFSHTACLMSNVCMCARARACVLCNLAACLQAFLVNSLL